MSIQAEQEVREMRDLAPREVLLLKAIAFYVNHATRLAWPSHERLRAETGQSRATFYRALAGLRLKKKIEDAQSPDGTTRTCYFMPRPDHRNPQRSSISMREKRSLKMRIPPDPLFGRTQNSKPRTKPPTPSRKREREKQGGISKTFSTSRQSNRPRSADHRSPTPEMLEARRLYLAEMTRQGRLRYAKGEYAFYREGLWERWRELTVDPAMAGAKIGSATPFPVPQPPIPPPSGPIPAPYPPDEDEDEPQAAQRQAEAKEKWRFVQNKFVSRNKFTPDVQTIRAEDYREGVLYLRSPLPLAAAELADIAKFGGECGIERIEVCDGR